MSFIISLIGLMLLVIVMADFLITAVGTNETSPLAMPVGKFVFHLFRRLPDTALKHMAVGPVILATVASLWLICVNLSWAMIFYGFSGSIVNKQTTLPPGGLGYIAHAGQLLSTAGSGTTAATSDGFSLLGVIVAVNGMIVLTLSVSFIMATTNTVVTGRKLFLYLQQCPDAEESLTKDVAGLIAELNAAPFALFFSHQRQELRVPQQLFELCVRHCPGRKSDWCGLALAIPYISRYDSDTLSGQLDQWRADFTVETA